MSIWEPTMTLGPRLFRNRAVMPVLGEAVLDSYGAARTITRIESEVLITYERDGENPRTVTLDEWHNLADSCDHDRAMNPQAHDTGA